MFVRTFSCKTQNFHHRVGGGEIAGWKKNTKHSLCFSSLCCMGGFYAKIALGKGFRKTDKTLFLTNKMFGWEWGDIGWHFDIHQILA